jgi:6-pyruvoyltetrahydropterin/6-carboxytetrahydropterin synthase
MKFESTKIIELGSCAFRQWRADSHCKYIHGYRLVAKFWFECDKLDERNWVVDFGGLKELKQVLEKQFDHTLCISADDPLAEHFQALHTAGAVDLRIMHKGVGIERTAEWCFDVADAHVRGITNNRCWVGKVEVWEHDKNSAIASFEYTRVPEYNPYVAPEAQSAVASALPDMNIATTVNAGINVEKQVAAEQATSPLGSQIEHIPLKKEIRSAPVGNKVTTGYSNLFAGTSWGK